MANETITGKIFTLKDPTGTYNRFPRTVMEAVYGLNTYLQNQFSALADIYMPIEGITETKPLQEFVYRKSPATIKAKSLTLDRIYGKTLAWNQSAKEISSSNWHVLGSTSATFSNGVASFTAVAQYGGISQDGTLLNVVAGHYYYTCYESISTMSYGKGRLSDGADDAITCVISGPSTSFIKNANVKQASSSGQRSIVFWDVRTSDWDEVKIRNVQVVDLTLLYGSAIDGLTTDQMKAKYESEFPGYHSYEPGKLISNDAESIETVGFNQWDEEWEVGGINSTNGTNVNTTTNRIRSKNYIPVFGGMGYYVKNGGSGTVWVFTYDANKNFITYFSANNAGFTTDAATAYIRICHDATYGTTYNHDICINLSDPAKNGTYEPYRKSVMQLNLGSFQVRDSQGNVTTITGGLKSAGSVKDEIVGNKYIKRVGRVNLGELTWGTGGSSNQLWWAEVTPEHTLSANGVSDKYIVVDRGANSLNVANTISLKDNASRIYYYPSTNPTPTGYFDYELATPIEYTLVSPLVPTVAAGTTEARISPNADGLSAPMVADMTYDAQANNDSASAQYALTAGRLLNSHKLWGQDFDGTQDVTGDLTGVGNIAFAASGKNIASLLYFDTTNGRVGVGAAPGAYKLDVGGTLHTSGAATIGGTLDVGGATTLTGALTANGAVSINNTLTVGTAQTNRATTLNGTLTATGAAYLDSTVRIGGSSGITLTYVPANNGLNFNKGIYSDSYITAGAVNSSSDARLKNGITPVFNAMDTIMALKPSEWIWNEKHHLNGRKGAGLVAQEVEKVLPFAVAKEGEYLSLNYNVFHAYEIAGLQNHEERIAYLENRVRELEERLGA